MCVRVRVRVRDGGGGRVSLSAQKWEEICL